MPGTSLQSSGQDICKTLKKGERLVGYVHDEPDDLSRWVVTDFLDNFTGIVFKSEVKVTTISRKDAKELLE